MLLMYILMAIECWVLAINFNWRETMNDEFGY